MATSADFETFFLDHYERLVRSLTAITSDPQRAEDCVQEAFIRASARWQQIRRLDNPATWVRRVAINLGRDTHRSETRRRRREDATRSQLIAPSPADGIAADLDLVELLRELTPQQRAVAALFYVEDISVADIADTLELSQGAVKFHLNKARTGLRTMLEAEEVRHG